jgi:hypothetical protein
MASASCGGSTHRRVSAEVVGHGEQRPGQQQVVRVQVRHDLARGVGEPQVDRVRLAPVLAHVAVVQPVAVLVQHRRGRVRRAAVLHHVLEPRVLLVEHAPDGALEERPLVVRRGDDGNQRRVGQRRLEVIPSRHPEHAGRLRELELAELDHQPERHLHLVPQPQPPRQPRAEGHLPPAHLRLHLPHLPVQFVQPTFHLVEGGGHLRGQVLRRHRVRSSVGLA